jgi:hypothetical protein
MASLREMKTWVLFAERLRLILSEKEQFIILPCNNSTPELRITPINIQNILMKVTPFSILSEHLKKV